MTRKSATTASPSTLRAVRPMAPSTFRHLAAARKELQEAAKLEQGNADIYSILAAVDLYFGSVTLTLDNIKIQR